MDLIVLFYGHERPHLPDIGGTAYNYKHSAFTIKQRLTVYANPLESNEESLTGRNMAPNITDTERQVLFGKYLKQLREDKGLSLRDVEEKTKNQVSNAYLSQVENGKISQPSPSILHALSTVYDDPYEKLMIEAGYLAAKDSSTRGRHQARAATYAVDGLTPDEAHAVRAYLQLYRRQRRGG